MIEGTYDFVDVRDLVKGAINVAEHAAKGSEYILSGYQITFKQFFYILNNLIGRKAPKLYIPNWLLKLFVPILGFFSKILGKVPTLTSYALYTISSNSFFSHEKATEELDYYPRHIARTMKKTIECYKQIGELS